MKNYGQKRIRAWGMCLALAGFLVWGALTVAHAQDQVQQQPAATAATENASGTTAADAAVTDAASATANAADPAATSTAAPSVTQLALNPRTGAPTSPFDFIQDENAPFETALPAFYSKSLFLTDDQILKMRQALIGLQTTAGAAAIPEIRQIKIGGILYKHSNDWLVWINGKRVMPGRTLPEIIDIKVNPTNIDLLWYDIGFNKVLKIRLRAHQTYDIGTGILLATQGMPQESKGRNATRRKR